MDFNLNNKISFSFNGFYLLQGSIVFALVFVCLFTLTNYLFPPKTITQSQIIKSQNIVTTPSSQIIVGKPVKWVKLVKVSDIEKSKNKTFVALPKNAKNITVNKVPTQKGFWGKAIKFLTADLQEAVAEIIAPNENPPVEVEAEVEVITTDTAIYIDLQDQVSEKPQNPKSPATSGIPLWRDNAQENPNDQNPNDENEAVETSIVEPVTVVIPDLIGDPELNASTLDSRFRGNDTEKQDNDTEEQGNDTEKQDNDTEEQGNDTEKQKEEDKQEKENKQESDSEVDNSSLRGSEPAGETDEAIPTQENTQADEIATPRLGGARNDTDIEPTVDMTVEVPVETSEEELVKIEYETPSPKIEEKETDTGKLVTISSDAEKVCEKLNPAKEQNTITEQVISFFKNTRNAVTQVTKAIAKQIFKPVIFLANLEESVSPIIPDIPDISLLETTSPSDAPVLENSNIQIPMPNEIPNPNTQSESNDTPSVIPDLIGDPELSASTLDSLLQGNDTLDIPASSSQIQDSEKAYQDCLANQPELTNVLASTKIPEIYKVGQESKIKIKWLNENGEEMPFTARDTNNNGKLDYVEWTVPHLSEQIFEIIFISKAWLLDPNLEIQEDIYDQVKTKEGTWEENTYSTIQQGNYIRVTFEQILDNTKDITIYARPNSQSIGNAIIEVYPVYVDQQGNETQGAKIAEFPVIDKEDTYQILLTELQEPTDKFDLKIVRGDY